MDAELAKTVRELQDRQAIYDCIMRYCRGVDRLDRELLASAYHPDAIDDHGSFVGPAAQFVEWVIKLHGTLQRRTQHTITNHIVELDGDVAHAESYYIYRGLNREAPWHSIASGRYIDRLEKRGGRWGIVARICTTDILDDHWDPDGVVEDGDHVRTARDPSDPSYQRPLVVDRSRFTV
jgi:hypothetical protein